MASSEGGPGDGAGRAAWVAAAVLVAWSAAESAEPVSLTFKTGTVASRVFTPARSRFGGRPFSIQGDKGHIEIAGQAVAFGVRYSPTQKAFYGALDADGDGELSPKEYVRFGPSMSASYTIRVGGRSCAVRLGNVRVAQERVGGPAVGITGGYVVNGCYVGTFGGRMLRLFDDNLDGKITQDGQDAVAFGTGPFAIPLGRRHQFGETHYDVTVAPDGTSVTLTPAGTMELARVETPFRRGLRCMALYDEAGGNSYDLALSGRGGIPPGRYRLVYGVLTAGKMNTVVQPTEKALTYDIEAGKINALSIGPPLMVAFRARWSDGAITVYPTVRVFGCGGEEYAFAFSGGTGRPHVLLFAGRRQVSDTPMEYG